ncbi:hypothetical protein B5F39_10945 [Cloacibacillus sp. An23]|nr:hypothetical protein B5F39_10945 [Cloacibacillus sp. An23]
MLFPSCASLMTAVPKVIYHMQILYKEFLLFFGGAMMLPLFITRGRTLFLYGLLCVLVLWEV